MRHCFAHVNQNARPNDSNDSSLRNAVQGQTLHSHPGIFVFGNRVLLSRTTSGQIFHLVGTNKTCKMNLFTEDHHEAAFQPQGSLSCAGW